MKSKYFFIFIFFIFLLISQSSLNAQSLNKQEIDGIMLMREEEKLARDEYGLFIIFIKVCRHIWMQ